MNNLAYKIAKFLIKENTENEGRSLSDSSMERIHNAMDDYAKKIYGNEYGELDTKKTEFYFPKGEAEVKKDLNISSGLFSVGNDKLSDDTLIINFTSALGCPSINDCPISQKACYAVAQENRLKDARRKNIMIQNVVAKAYRQHMLSGFFRIAEMYARELLKTKRPLKYIRFNEVGDFVNQNMLEMAAKFAYRMRKKYGIKSMAYTAKKTIDPSQPIKVDGKEIPIDQIIAMNRSRADIKISDGSVDRNFYGIELPKEGFSEDPNVNLENAYSDVCQVTDTLANKLDVIMPQKDENGDPCIPVLRYGAWNGGNGWYYVCPCSFWKYNKIKAANEFFKQKGIFTLLNNKATEILKNERKAAGKKGITKTIELLSNIESYPDDNQGVRAINSALSKLENYGVIPSGTKDELDRVLKRIKSPCGRKCSVCHDTQGGITPSGETVKKYTILTATHGSTASNYNAEYANAKREGRDNDVKYSETNPFGHVTKYKDAYNKKYKDDKVSQDSLDNDAELQKEEILRENKENFYRILKNITKIK